MALVSAMVAKLRYERDPGWITMTPDQLRRFLMKVEPEPTSGCHLWSGAVQSAGYGHMLIVRHPRKRWGLAHRLAFEHWRGEILDGLEIDHKCSNPLCVNPEHLRMVTGRENTLAPWSRSIAKLNSEKRYCPAGHPYDGRNLIVRRRGGRECRQCVNRFWREGNVRRRARTRAMLDS